MVVSEFPEPVQLVEAEYQHRPCPNACSNAPFVAKGNAKLAQYEACERPSVGWKGQKFTILRLRQRPASVPAAASSLKVVPNVPSIKQLTGRGRNGGRNLPPLAPPPWGRPCD